MTSPLVLATFVCPMKETSELGMTFNVKYTQRQNTIKDANKHTVAVTTRLPSTEIFT